MEILGATGCALAVLGAALMIGNRAYRVLYPVIAIGMMPLTIYVAHVIAIWLIQAELQSWLAFAAFTVSAMTLAVTWLHYFGSGPLERILRTASNTASKLLNAEPPVAPPHPGRLLPDHWRALDIGTMRCHLDR